MSKAVFFVAACVGLASADHEELRRMGVHQGPDVEERRRADTHQDFYHVDFYALERLPSKRHMTLQPGDGIRMYGCVAERVREFPSKEAMEACDYTNAKFIGDIGSYATFYLPQEWPAEYYLSCGPDIDFCENGVTLTITVEEKQYCDTHTCSGDLEDMPGIDRATTDCWGDCDWNCCQEKVCAAITPTGRSSFFSKFFASYECNSQPECIWYESTHTCKDLDLHDERCNWAGVGRYCKRTEGCKWMPLNTCAGAKYGGHDTPQDTNAPQALTESEE